MLERISVDINEMDEYQGCVYRWVIVFAFGEIESMRSINMGPVSACEHLPGWKIKTLGLKAFRAGRSDLRDRITTLETFTSAEADGASISRAIRDIAQALTLIHHHHV